MPEKKRTYKIPKEFTATDDRVDTTEKKTKPYDKAKKKNAKPVKIPKKQTKDIKMFPKKK